MNVVQPRPHISIITSSTTLPLDKLSVTYPLTTVDLYIPREKDMQLIFGDLPCVAKTASEVMHDLDFDALPAVAARINDGLGDLVPVAISTYFPEVVSVDSDLYDHAVGGLRNVLRLADLLGVRTCEFVAGRLAEECADSECDVVIFDGKSVDSWRLHKIGWLIDAVTQLHADVLSWPDRQTDVRLALEMEPGSLFVANGPEHISRVLAETVKYKLPSVENGGLPGEDPYYTFCNFNCDIGHLRLLDPQMLPGEFWSRLFTGADPSTGILPWTRVAGFHISDHPYNRIHVDSPPGLHEWNLLSPDRLIDGDCTDPGFTPWLNCALCLQRKRAEAKYAQINISLELEAEVRDDRVKEAYVRLTSAIDTLVALQGSPAWQEHAVQFCSGCPMG